MWASGDVMFIPAFDVGLFDHYALPAAPQLWLVCSELKPSQ